MGSRQWLASLLCVTACVVSGCISSTPVLPVSLITINGAQPAPPRSVTPRCYSPNWSPQGTAFSGVRGREGLSERLHREITHNRTYPELARRYGWQGTVQLCVMMERDGRFSRVTVLTSSGNAFLDNEAIQMVRSVQMTDLPSPATWTQVWFQIPVAYELTSLPPSHQALVQAVKMQVLRNREYPAEAIPSKLEGNTVLGATVGPDGSVQQMDVRQSSGSDILDQAAKDLLARSAPFPMQQWQFDSPVYLLIPFAYRYE